jgi:hypothetical protein
MNQNYKLFVLLILLFYLSNFCIAQKLVNVEVLLNDSLIEINKEYYNKDDKLWKLEYLKPNKEVTRIIIIEDSSTTHFYYKNGIIESKLIYKVDEFDNITEIINLDKEDSIKSKLVFHNHYQDTLIVNSTCISGCEYELNYYYNDQGLIIKSERIKLKTKDIIWSEVLQYNKDNKLEEHTYLPDNSNNSHQKFKYEYDLNDKLKVKENHVKKDDQWELFEKTTFKYDNNLLIEKILISYNDGVQEQYLWKYLYETIKN